jgi:uncharacterized membrane protein (UPF0127 family)
MAQHNLIKSLNSHLVIKRSLTLTLTGVLGVAIITSVSCSAVQSDPLGAPQDAPNAVESPDAASPGDATAMPSSSPGQQLPISAVAEIADQEILLEVASTRRQQALGLMFREPLPDNRGMLFPLAPPRPVNFWMKNVPVPLDMIFIYNGTIQAIAADVPPCESDPCPTYGPGDQLIDHVIELRGGHAAELGLAVGDAVVISPVTP